MTNRKRRLGLLSAATLGTLLMSLCASAATPNAPSTICIDSACTSASAAAGLTGKKWHPGNYMHVNEQIFTTTDSTRFAWYDRIKSEPLIKGAAIVAPWGVLEHQKGVYDFSQIDKDLAYLKGMNKRLIIEVWWMDYWHALPTVPQSGIGWLPDYIISNGCAIGGTNGGYTVQLHKQECMDPLIALFQALGKRYNADSSVEQIIITEPSFAYPTWDANLFYTQFQRLIPAVAAAWPNTSVAFYMNWFAQPGGMAAINANNGVGIGGPDILPPSPIAPSEDDGSRALRGAGGNYGTVDYRGRIPVSYAYEAIYSLAPTVLIDYALNTLKATHIEWSATDGLSSQLNWDTGVMPVIKAKNGQVGSTACPSAYNGQCVTQ